MELSQKQLLALYRTMVLIREFEERFLAETMAGKLMATGHLCVGQEAVAAGVCANLRPDDYITSTHRGHGHCIAKGVDVKAMMAVAQTIRDRSSAWKMTPVEVVTQKGQYAAPYEGEISDPIREAVRRVFDEGESVLEVPTTHFFSGSTPSWAAEKVSRGRIGSHEFYY
jgi:TPP-dependent pyruvate/acetoin dehydrogenase alpha subunit